MGQRCHPMDRGTDAPQRDKAALLADRLVKARSVLFITGAGISADSGLPTYRGIGGLYNSNHTEDGVPIEDALSGEMIAARPEITWKYLRQIEETCRGARFNRAHEIIAQAENNFEHVCVLTQNIDGFHRAAGSRNVIEIHGNMHRLFCTRCDEYRQVQDYSDLPAVPRCKCGGLVRPDVVLFNEQLPEDEVQRIYDEVRRGPDVVFSIGTSSVFPYIAMPVVTAARAGAVTVEINPSETNLSDLVDFKFAEGAAAALENIWSCMRKPS